MTRPRKNPGAKRDSNPGPSTLEADALTTRPPRRSMETGRQNRKFLMIERRNPPPKPTHPLWSQEQNELELLYYTNIYGQKTTQTLHASSKKQKTINHFSPRVGHWGKLQYLLLSPTIRFKGNKNKSTIAQQQVKWNALCQAWAE